MLKLKGPIDPNNIIGVKPPANLENAPSNPQGLSSEAVSVPEVKAANQLGVTADDVLSYDPLEKTSAYIGTASEADTAIATTGEAIGWMDAAGTWFGAALGALNPATIVALALVGLAGIGYGVYYAYRLYENNVRSQQTLEAGAELAQKGLSDDNRDAVSVVAKASGQQHTTNTSSASPVPRPLPTVSAGSGAAAATPVKTDPGATADNEGVSMIGAWYVTWRSPYMYSTGILTVGSDYLAKWAQKEIGRPDILHVAPPFGCADHQPILSDVPFKEISPGLYKMKDKMECLNNWTETVLITVMGNTLRGERNIDMEYPVTFSGSRLK